MSGISLLENQPLSQAEVERRFHVPSSRFNAAVERGYIIPGWNLIDYLRHAIKGMGFENVAIWGKQGSRKSNFMLQLGYAIYQDWDTVLDRVILTKDDLLKIYREVKGSFERIPCILLDDITTILPPDLYHEDRRLYILMQKFLTVVRPKVSVIISTLPNIDRIWGSLGEVMTFEVIVYPNMTYLVERYCWDINPEKPVKANFYKIAVEYASFKQEDVPRDVFRQYHERRMTMVDEVVRDLEGHLGEPDGRDIERRILKAVKQIKIEDIMNSLRSKGYRFNDKVVIAALRAYRKAIQEALT